jgi:hypothetical protein
MWKIQRGKIEENFSNSFPKLESLGERERKRQIVSLRRIKAHTHTNFVRHFNYVPLFIHAELN